MTTPAPSTDSNHAAASDDTKDWAAASAEVDQVADDLKNANIEPAPVPTATGLDPNDMKGDLMVENGGAYWSATEFEQLQLDERLLKGVYAKGFVHPSKIQAVALPIILRQDRPNFVGQALAGSGKTAAFVLAMLSTVDCTVKSPQAICLANTRELALQTQTVTLELAKFMSDFTCFAAVQESSRDPVTAQVVVGTPGTMLAKARGGELDLKHVKIIVIDEADELLKEVKDNEKKKPSLAVQTMDVRKRCPKNAQVLLFSATFPDQLNKFAAAIAPNAARITVKKEDLSLKNVVQYAINVPNPGDRVQLLKDIYGLINIGQCIIFLERKDTCQKVASLLREDGFAVSMTSSDLTASQRDATLQEFREGKTTVLLATNVLARGVDVPNVNVVINFDMPLLYNKRADTETFIHRVGRAGRFGRPGIALNFTYDNDSARAIESIAHALRVTITPLENDCDKIAEAIKKAL